MSTPPPDESPEQESPEQAPSGHDHSGHDHSGHDHSGHDHPGHDRPEQATAEPSEEELRAAFEEQLRKITATDVIVQTAVSLINIAGRRLGTAPGSEDERDLTQVRDAIDGVRGLLPVLERGEMAQTLGPLRDAVAAIQVEYAKLVATAAAGGSEPAKGGPEPEGAGGEETPPGGKPGPAQSSGRLWVPGS
jgi:hypothetical protein